MKEYIIGIDPGIGQSAASLIESNFPDRFEVMDYVCPKVNKDYDWLHKAELVANSIINFASNRVLLKYTKFAIEKPIVRPWGTMLINQFLFVGACIYCMTTHLHMMGHDCKWYFVNPNTAKLALTGNGRAKKKDMIHALESMKEFDEDISQETKAEREAIADSVGIALAVAKKLNGVERLC